MHWHINVNYKRVGLFCNIKDIGRGYTQISPDKKRRGHNAEVKGKRRKAKDGYHTKLPGQKAGTKIQELRTCE